MSEAVIETSPEIEAIEAIAEEMKTPGSFKLADAVKKVSYPSGKTEPVFTDGHAAGRLASIAGEIYDLTNEAATYSAKALGGITDAPEKDVLDAKIAELEVEKAEQIKLVLASQLTFHMRGVAPKVWRIIDSKARAQFKLSDKNNEEHILETNLKRNEYVNIECVKHSIVKIENAEGAFDESGMTTKDVEQLQDVLLQTEWDKIKSKMEELTFAARLFANATDQDADFLPQP